MDYIIRKRLDLAKVALQKTDLYEFDSWRTTPPEATSYYELKSYAYITKLLKT